MIYRAKRPAPTRLTSHRPLALCLGLGALLTALVLATVAQAAPGQITEVPLSKRSAPLEITTGADGNLWFTDVGFRGPLKRPRIAGQSWIGRIIPSGQITEFPLPAGQYSEHLTAGPDGNLWFTTARNRIGRITPSGQITEFPVPGVDRELGSIVADPDGNLWFADTDRIGRIIPSGQITEFPLPARQFSEGLTAGPDGNLWFTTGHNKIGSITPSGRITEFPIPCHFRCLLEDEGLITTGPDGNLWFGMGGEGALGSFGEPGPSIGQITPSGRVTKFRTSVEEEPTDLTSGPDGDLWFTESVRGRIGRITSSGLIAEFPIPGAKAWPWGITAGPGGNLWFTDPGQDKIGRITPGRLGVGIADAFGLVKNDWTKIELDCSGGALHQICQGTLRLGYPRLLLPSSKEVVFAIRHYRMRSGTSRWFRLHLSKRGLFVLHILNGLPYCTASISLNGVKGTSRRVDLEEHPAVRRVHQRR